MDAESNLFEFLGSLSKIKHLWGYMDLEAPCFYSNSLQGGVVGKVEGVF